MNKELAMETKQQPVTYDKYGRMNYHPDYHDKNKQPWMAADQKFLIDNYYLMGPEQVSFALGRTIHTIMTRAYKLRKSGSLVKQNTRHKRCREDATAAK